MHVPSPWANAAVCLIAVMLAQGNRIGAAEQARRPNVLFIAIDDLRVGLGAGESGKGVSATPHLDSLAASGRLFTRHYTQVPTCGASRCALWRGQYPDKRAHLDNGAIFKTYAEWAEKSLPGQLRQHGYRTLALGKITHYPGGRTGRLWRDGPEEFPGAWDRSWIPETPWGEAQHMMHGYANGVPRKAGESPPWESVDGADDSYPDAWIAQEAVATLRELFASEQPWFFAVGFFKPHLPFAAPQRYFELTAPDTLSGVESIIKPQGISSWHGSGEFRRNYGHGGMDLAEDKRYEQLIRHAYAAATRYMDAQVGKLLKALDDLDPQQETIVVAWSDHGFLLGEHAIWGKHCLYEKALQSPLIIRAPVVGARGEPCRQIVETVDLHPTVLQLCGLGAPSGMSGKSLVPQLADAGAVRARPAVGFWGNQRTLRTDRWRLIVHESQDGQQRGVELFDMQADPHELHNVAAARPDKVALLMKTLQELPRPMADR